MEFFVGECFAFVGIVSFPDDGSLITTGFKMAVKTIIGNIEFSIGEPVDIMVINTVAVIKI